MANSTNQILNKSIKELRSKKNGLELEILSLNLTISNIENLITEDNRSIVNKKDKKTKKKSKSNRRALITENSVRDGIIEWVKNPINVNNSGMHGCAPGYFTSSNIANVIGVSKSSGSTISKFLEKFELKGIVESKVYKNGKQYKYISPTVTGPGKEFEQSKAIAPPTNISASAPIPGTGKNGLTLRNKDIEKLVNKAVSEGFTAERLGSDHLRISKSGKIATISTTGTDKARYVENCRSDLKRIGVQV